MAGTSPERSIQHSIAAHAMWARTPDRAARLANAHAGVEARIARDYGISADLPADQYAQRIESAKRAYFRSLALKSVQARRRKAAERGASPGGRQAA